MKSQNLTRRERRNLSRKVHSTLNKLIEKKKKGENENIDFLDLLRYYNESKRDYQEKVPEFRDYELELNVTVTDDSIQFVKVSDLAKVVNSLEKNVDVLQTKLKKKPIIIFRNEISEEKISKKEEIENEEIIMLRNQISELKNNYNKELENKEKVIDTFVKTMTQKNSENRALKKELLLYREIHDRYDIKTDCFEELWNNGIVDYEVCGNIWNWDEETKKKEI